MELVIYIYFTTDGKVRFIFSGKSVFSLQHKKFFSPFEEKGEREGGRDVKGTSLMLSGVEYGLCGGILVNCVVPHSLKQTILSYDNAISAFLAFPEVFIDRRTQVDCVSGQISNMSDE